MKSHVFEREKLQDAELPSGHQERNTSSGPKLHLQAHCSSITQ